MGNGKLEMKIRNWKWGMGNVKLKSDIENFKLNIFYINFL